MSSETTVTAIIQARMGSTRFPGKVLEEVRGRPLLWHGVKRAQSAENVTNVVIATSTKSQDDAIAEFCDETNVHCFRGSEEDVLERYYQAAVESDSDAIVRLTGDDPLKDPKVIERVVDRYLQTTADYVSNTLQYTYPDGMDVEVFSFDVLERAHQEATGQTEREHVTVYIKRAEDIEKQNVEADITPSEYGVGEHQTLRWTVDYPADLEFVREVYRHLGVDETKPFGYDAVLELLSEEPQLLEINDDTVSNEGFYRSIIEEDPVPAEERSLERSMELKHRAETLIPNQAQTLSKSPTQFTQGVAPTYVERAEDCYVWDVDGNRYIDLPMAIGPPVLGHQYPAVENAVEKQRERGTSFSLPHTIELEVAEKIHDMIPYAEMVRFGKNGSDVSSCAVRLARSYTGRDKIATCGYHGFQDWYISTKETYNEGIPESVKEDTLTFEYNDINSLKELFEEYPNEIAGVIMEPTLEEQPEEDFLSAVRDLTREEDTVLIFDEIKMGFRVPNFSAGSYFGVEPDLACFGKAIANGHPLSAIVGSEIIMRELEDSTFYSLTFGGEALSLAAAEATLDVLESERVVSHIWQEGRRIKNGYNTFAEEYGIADYTECVGLPPWSIIEYTDNEGNSDPALKTLFQQECLKRNVLFGGYHIISYAHDKEDIDRTLRVYRTAMEELADAIKTDTVHDRIDGDVIQPVFE